MSNDHRHQSPTISRWTKTNSLGCAQSSSTTTRCRKNAECNISCFICCSRWSSSPLNLLLSQWYGCGATLISCDPVIIVSAAHCFYGLVQRSPTNLIFSSQAENIVLVQHNDDAEMMMMITIMMIRSADLKKWLKSKQLIVMTMMIKKIRNQIWSFRLSSFSISTLRVACGDHVSKCQCLCIQFITKLFTNCLQNCLVTTKYDIRHQSC